MSENIIHTIKINKIIDIIENSICPICGEKINIEDFTDEISKSEFYISGICQKCQDEIFNNNEDDEYDFFEENDDENNKYNLFEENDYPDFDYNNYEDDEYFREENDEQ